MTFNELGLGDQIISAVSKLGFVQPTPIQEQVIPYLLQNEGDLIGLASTGTGKTAAFGLPMLEIIDPTVKNVQGLIVCPTRELCMQIAKDLQAFSSDMPKTKIVAVYGGSDIQRQIKKIQDGAQIVVATPGRLIDLINRKKVKLSNVEVVVLDEADEMLNMGFKEDIDQILEKTPDFKNVWLFSATMPKAVARIAQSYMNDPFEVTVGGKNESNKNIEHQYYVVRERDRYDALKRIIDFNPGIYGLIFCRTRRETGKVADQLVADGYNAEALHGELSQAQRDRVMGKFRDKTLQLLVATDVAARGIDVDDITHVLNYNLPDDVENYTHRSGRTARAGKKGVSIVIINTKEGRKIKTIESIIKTSFEKCNLPNADDICELQLMKMVNEVSETEVDEKSIEKYMSGVMEKLGHFSKEELIQKFVSAEFNKFLKYYSKAANLDAAEDNRSGERKFGDKKFGDKRENRRSSDSGGGLREADRQRFFVNLGRKDGFNSGALLRLVCDHAGISKDQIGKIDILRNFSFFDAHKSETPRIVTTMQNIKFDGKILSVEETSTSQNNTSKTKKKIKKKHKK